MIRSSAPNMKPEAITAAVAAPRPKAVSALRTGQRITLRQIMMLVWLSARCAITRSAMVCRKAGGAGGCIAMAGGSRAAISAALSAPAMVVASAASPDMP